MRLNRYLKRTWALAVTVATMTAAMLCLPALSLAEGYVFPVALTTPAETDITKEAAIAVAQSEIERRKALTAGEIDTYEIQAAFVTLENGENAWVVAAENVENNYLRGTALILSAAEGRVIDYQQEDNGGLIIAMMEQWQQRLGDKGAWSLEVQQLFHTLYGAGQNAIPGPEHISQEEATRIALSALSKPPKKPEFQYSFKHYTQADTAWDEYTWYVTILENGVKKYQVNISAIDGRVIDVFDLGNGLG